MAGEEVAVRDVHGEVVLGLGVVEHQLSGDLSTAKAYAAMESISEPTSVRPAAAQSIEATSVGP